jgi:hypothetical protein
LKLDEEIRQITAKFRASEHRDSLELVSRWAVRPDDLMQALLEVRPHIVHFSGHGSSRAELIRLEDQRDLRPVGQEEGLILLDDQGSPKPVSKEALDHLFRILKDNIRVVVLNACYSRSQAEAIAETIDCTIGTNRSIGDEAAIIFAASFYRAVGFGLSAKEAFELGKAALLLEGISEEKTLDLLTRPGVDAASLVLIAPSTTEVPGVGVPEAKVPSALAGVPARLALVRELIGLAPTDLATVVTSIPGAATHVSRHGTVPEQVAELVRWAESSTGPGLTPVEEALKELRNP